MLKILNNNGILIIISTIYLNIVYLHELIWIKNKSLYLVFFKETAISLFSLTAEFIPSI